MCIKKTQNAVFHAVRMAAASRGIPSSDRRSCEKKYLKGCVATFLQQRSLFSLEREPAHGCTRMRSLLIWPHFQALMMRWKVVSFHRF